MRIYLLLAFLMTSLSAFSQDTIQIFFEFGSSKIDSKATSRLNSIRSEFDLSDLDSIHFIGYTDSVGNIKNNMKLSSQRAKNAYKYCKNSLNENTTFSILAKGVGQNKSASINRRVDVILYFPKPIIPEEEEVVSEPEASRCFYVDYPALSYCNFRTIKKKKKNFVQIEAMNVPRIRDTTQYYVVENPNGQVEVKKLKWTLKKTGTLWWRKERLTATIPEEGFKKFKFFTLKKEPCDGCGEYLFHTDTILAVQANWLIDDFLTDNIQYKTKFFSKNDVEIRVPREYVDTSLVYISPSHNSQDTIKWSIKKSQKHKDLYFATLQINVVYLPEIFKETPFIACQNQIGDDGLFELPGTMAFLYNKYFQISLSPGVFYQNDSLTTYFSLGLTTRINNLFYHLNLGLNTTGGFYGSSKLLFDLYYFPITSKKPINRWKPATSKRIRPDSSLGRFYVGLEFKTSYNQSHRSFLESNLHLGFSYTNSRKHFPDFFIHGGIARDFSNTVSSSFYPILEIGLTMKLFHFKKY